MKKSFAVASGLLVAGAGVVGIGIGTIFAGIVRVALRAERAVDDGPDDLLTVPDRTPRHPEVRTADGSRLNVEVYDADDVANDRDILVLVHGWTCNTAFWYPQINALAGPRTVVAYDQRGHGASERGRQRPTMAMLGQDLESVLRAVVPDGRRAVLVGHSMGGMTIMSWAAQYPDQVSRRVSAVALTSTAAKAVLQNHALIPLNLPRYTHPFEATVAKMFTSAPVPIPKTRYGAVLSHYVALGPNARQAHVDFVTDMINTCPPRSRAGWGSAMGRLDVTAGLNALTVPTTIIVGTEDRLTPPAHAEQMAEALRRNNSLRDLVIYEGVGHMSSIEAAGRFNDLLSQILGEVDQAPTVQQFPADERSHDAEWSQ